MRNLILSALFLASAFQTALGQIVEGQWTYIIENGGATITRSTATGAVTIPSMLGGYPVKRVVGHPWCIFVEGKGEYNSSVTSIIFPNSVTSIGYGAFFGCNGLTALTLPNSVTSIEENAFGNSSLTSISIPISVTDIGQYAFGGCSSLISISIPNSVTSIGQTAFYGCASLTSISIPNSVTSIGYIAFGLCSSLVNVYLPARFADTYTNFGLTAAQANFGITLTASCNSSEGTILVNPIKIPYEAGESVVVTATPKAGYLFGNWSGASTAMISSITLTMDDRKSLTANFIQDGRDTDGDSLTNYQESITYGTNPNQKDSNLDGVEDGHAVSMGYSPTLNFSALVAHPPTGLYTANQMQAMAIGDLVLTKNANGSFTLNYDIEQSADLQTWTTYAPLSLPLTGLPTDKAFVRIQIKTTPSTTTPTTPATATPF